MQSIGILNRLGKDSAIYGVSSAMGRFVHLFLAPILTRIFSPEDYGVIALIQLAIGFATIFGGLNIGSGIGYHYFAADSEKDKNRALIGGFWIGVLIAGIMCVILLAFASQVSEFLMIRKDGPILGHNLKLYIEIGALGMLFGVLQTSLCSMLRFLAKPFSYLLVQLSQIFVTTISILVFVLEFKVGLKGVFIGSALGAFSGFFIAFLMLARKVMHKPSYPIFFAILLYALPQMPAVMLNWGQTQIGRYCINLYLTLQEQGIYAVSFAISSTLIVATTAFRLAYDPFALSVMKQPDANIIYAKTYKLYVCMFGIVLSFIASLSQPLVNIIFPNSYLNAHKLIPLLATSFFYLGASNILATGIWVSGRTIYTSYAQALAFLLTLPVYLILIPKIGILGAAIAFISSNILYNILVYCFAQKQFPVPYSYWKTHFWAIGVNIIFLFAGELSDKMNLLELICFGFVVGCFCTALLWFFFLNQDDHRYCKSYFRTFFKKIPSNSCL